MHSDTNPLRVAAESVDPRVGEVVAGRYRLIGRIGRGGMGSIYEAEHTSTGKRFALKTLLPGLDRIGDIARRFEREARASSVLNHPNVISVTDFGALEDGSLYLAMELVRGRPLGDLLDEGGVAQDRAFTIGRQVIEALGHAHAHGVIHRDLKPDNVMVLDAGESAEERDRVKLLDFGIAKVVGDAAEQVGGDKLTQAGVAFGTPDYMAPEQALGEAVDARADLYAMGVILFELFAGRKPFVNEDKIGVLRMQVSVPPPRLAEAAPGRWFAPALEGVIAKALEKRRGDRYANAEEMLAAFDAAAVAQLAGPAVAAAPVRAPGHGAARRGFALPFTLPFELPPWATRRNLAIGGGALGLLLIMLIVGMCSGDAHQGRPMGGPPAVKTEAARRGERLLAAGNAAGAVTLLEDETDGGAGADDAWAHLVLGHARAKLNKDIEAMAAYERALELAPDLRDDDAMRGNLVAMLGHKDKSAAVAAMAMVARLPGGDAIVVEQASRGKVKEVRRRARDLAAERGVEDRVDWVSSWSLDLQQGSSCRERAGAVPKLRALNDKAAIPALKKARSRTGGFLGLSDVNDCFDRDATEAIEYLEALP
jgi:eukaryotic-like serine/threonine-protein kinase